MDKLPFNAIPVFYIDGTIRDDSGKRVIINSIGGKSWPDDKFKRALENVKGTVVWGPAKLNYVAQAKNLTQKLKPGQLPNLKPQKFITSPYWCVLLDSYNLELKFVEEELKFI